jgi:nucleoside-diphosphate-sugar epimerase
MTGAVLITGASGFVGRHLKTALEQRGESVVTHSRSDGDIAHAGPVRHVFHLAARTSVPESWRDPHDFYRVNALGTVNALEFSRRAGASFTLLSSYVYGKPERLPVDENHPVHAANPYSHSKILAEQAALFYQETFSVPVTIVRAFNLYGPGQARDFLIPTIISQAIDSGTRTISLADLRPRRDYLFVEDFTALLVSLIDRPRSGIYNAGSGISISVRDLGERILRLAGVDKALVSRGEERPNEVMDAVADISRVRNEIGWAPKIGLNEGLMRTIEAAVRQSVSC